MYTEKLKWVIKMMKMKSGKSITRLFRNPLTIPEASDAKL